MVTALLLTAAVGLASLVPLARAATSDVPVEHFFRNPSLKNVRLSPDGKHLAAIVRAPNKDKRMALAIAEVSKPQSLRIIAHFDDGDVQTASWVNSKRLVFTVQDLMTELGNDAWGGLYAVDIDSENFTWLVARRWGEQDDQPAHRRPLRVNHTLLGVLPGETDDVLLMRYNLRERDNEPRSTMPIRINTRTRAQTDLVSTAGLPPGMQGWLLSAGDKPRVLGGSAVVEDTTITYLRAPDGRWEAVSKAHNNTGGAGAFELQWATPDGRIFVSASQDNAEQTSALFRLDPTSKRPETQPLFSLKGHDANVAPVLDRPSGRMMGISFETDAAGTVWFDPKLKAAQGKVDELLPGTVNVLTCSQCADGQHLIVTAYSDRQSPIYLLFDRQTEKLSLVGASRPWLDPRSMAQQDMVQIAARDGKSFPALVTRPQGKGPWPTVVLVHGGPYVRGAHWGWNPDTQFLASRGYLVVEPEFRGSTGYGFSWYQAGWKQWGLAMQDDITDATQWAVKQGLADPKRLVIAGASYGGYATMMGLVKEPTLYRAGINWVGVTDIQMLYDIGWSDMAGGEWMRHGMPVLIGDPKKDRDQLEKTSPLVQADRIQRPVLMAYGGKDLRVPLPHGKSMRDALRRSGKVELEWVEYEEEGHGWQLESNNVDFWTRVERFLAKHASP